MPKYETLSAPKCPLPKKVINLDKPYGFGSLSDEVVLLLRSLGISEAVLRRKQQEQSDFLSASTIYPIAAFRFLTYTNKTELAERDILKRYRAMERPNLQFNQSGV